MGVSKKERKDKHKAIIDKINAGEKYFQKDDLSGINLKGYDLKGINFAGTNLHNASFKKANLEAAVFDDCILSEANFNKANLEKASLQRVNLKKADLSEANLSEANLSEANLSSAVCTNVVLKKADLSDAILHQTVLNEIKATEAIFNGADLSGADGMDAEFIRADFKKAKFNKAIFSYANFAEADLNEAILKEADLTFCELKLVNLKKATLTRTNLKGAYGLSEEQEKEFTSRGAIVSNHYLKKFLEFLWFNKVARICTVLVFIGVGIFIHIYLQNPLHRSSDYLVRKAEDFHRAGNIEKTFAYYHIVANRKDIYFQLNAFNRIADIYFSQGKYADSIKVLKKSLSICEENLLDTDQICEIEKRIAQNLLLMQDSQKAISYLFERKNFYEGEEDIEVNLLAEAARIYAEAGNDAAAEKIDREVLSVDRWIDDNVKFDSLISLARLHKKNKQVEPSVSRYTEALNFIKGNHSLENQSMDILMEIVDLYYKNGLSSQGIAYFQKLLSENKSSKKLSLSIKIALAYLCFYSHNDALLSKLLSDLDGEKRYHVYELMALVNIEKKQYDSVPKNYRRAIKFAPDWKKVNLYRKWSDFYVSQGKKEKAISVLKQSIHRASNKMEALVDLGRLYVDFLMMSDAEKLFKELQESYPMHYLPYFEMAKLKKILNDYDSAEMFYDLSLERAQQPRQIAMLLRSKAQLYLDQQKIAEAKEVLTDAMKRFASKEKGLLINIKIDFIRVLRDEGKFLEAKQFCQDAIAEFKNVKGVVELYMELGLIAKELGEYDYAEKIYDKAMTQQENNEMAIRIIEEKVSIYHSRGDSAKAKEIFENAILKFKDNADMVVDFKIGLARLINEEGNLLEAKKIYESLLKTKQLKDRVSKVYLALGKIDHDLKNYKSAENFYDKALLTIIDKQQKAMIIKEKAKLYSDQGLKEQARQIINSAILDSTYEQNQIIEFNIFLAIMLKEEAKLVEAKQVCLDVLQKFKSGEGLASLYMELARIDYLLQDYEDAEKCFDKAVALENDRDQLAWMTREKVQMLIDLGDIEKVRRLLDKLIANNENIYDLRSVLQFKMDLANTFKLEGDLKEAKRRYLDILDSHDNVGNIFAEIYIALARIETEQSNFDAAYLYYDKAIAATRDKSQLGWMYTEKAQLYKAQGQYDKIKLLLKKSTEVLGENDAFVLQKIALADTLKDMGKVAEAKEAYQQILDQYATSKNIYLIYIQLARVAADEKKYKEAHSFYDKAINTVSDKGQLAWMIREKAKLYQQEGDTQKAKQLFFDALKMFSQDPNVFIDLKIALLVLLREEKELVSAKKVAIDLINTYPNSPRLADMLIELARINRDLGDYILSEEEYDKAIATINDKAKLSWLLGEKINLYILQNKKETAKKYLNEYIRAFSNSPIIVVNLNIALARLLKEEGDFLDAKDIYNEIVRDPNKKEWFGEVYLELARIERESKNYKEAISFYDKSLDYFNDLYRKQEVLGEKIDLYREQGDIAKAEEVLNSLIAKFGEKASVGFQLTLARILKEEGKFFEAQEICEKLTTLVDDPLARLEINLELARILKALKKNKKSLKLYNNIIFNFPVDRFQQVWVIDEAIQLYKNQGMLKQAKAFLLKLMDRFSHNIDAMIDIKINLIRILIAQGDFLEARKICNELINSNVLAGKKVDLYMLLAKIEKHLNNYSDAEKAYDTAINASNDKNQYYWMVDEKIQLLKRQGRFSEVKSVLLAAIDEFEDTPSIVLNFKINLIRFLIEQNELSEAKKLCEKIINTYSNNANIVEVYMQLAQINIGLNNYSIAHDLYDSALSMTSDDEQAYRICSEKIQLFIRQKKDIQAKEFVKKCLDRFNGNADITFNLNIELAKILEHEGDIKKAKKIYMRLLQEEHNKTPDVYIALARIARDAGSYAEAETLYDKAIAKQIDKASAYWTAKEKVELYDRQNLLDKAKKLLLKMIEENDEDIDILIDAKIEIAKILYKQGLLDDASDLYLELINTYQTNSRIGVVYAGVAQVEQARHNYEAAETFYDKALKTAQGKEQERLFLNRKIQLYKEQKAYDKAIASLQELIGQFKEDGDVVFNAKLELAHVLRTAGNKKEAEEIYKNLTTDYSTHAYIFDVYAILAQIAKEEKNYDKAETLYQKAEGVTHNKKELLGVLREKASLCIVSGKKEKAKKILRDCIKDAGDNFRIKIDCIFDLVRILREEGRLTEAESICLKLIQDSSHTYRLGDIYVELGNILKEMKNYSKAKQIYAQAIVDLKDDEQLPWIFKEKILLHSELGEIEEAKTLLLEAIERFKNLKERRIDFYLELIRILQKQGKLSEAKEICEKLVSSQDTTYRLAEINIELGRIFRQMKRYPEAEAAYETALSHEVEKNQLAWMSREKVRLYIEQGKFLEAKQLLEELQGMFLGDKNLQIDIKLDLADVSRKMKHFEEVEQIYTDILKDSSYLSQDKARDIYIAYARLEKELKNYKVAEELYDKALKNFSNLKDSSWVLREKGSLYRDQKDFSKLISFLSETIKKLSNKPSILFGFKSDLASALMDVEKFEEAKKIYLGMTTIYKNDKRLAGVYSQLGFIYRHLHQYEDAINAYEKALNLETDERQQVWLLREKAQIYLQQGEKERAVQFLKNMLDRFKHNNMFKIDILLDMANIYTSLDQWKKSKELYESILKDNKTNYRLTDAYVSLARIERRSENYEVAEAYYDKAIALDKDKQQLSWMLREKAQLYSEKGEIALARETLSSILSQFKEDKGIVFGCKMDMANLLILEKKEEEAKVLLHDLIKTYGENMQLPDVYVSLARIERNQKNYQEAGRLYTKAVNLIEGMDQFSWVLEEKLSFSIEIGDLVEAKNLIQKLLNRKELDSQAKLRYIYELGKIYLQEGNFPEAERCFTSVVKDPLSDEDILNFKMDIFRRYWKIKRYPQAQEALKILLRDKKYISSLDLFLEEATRFYKEMGDYYKQQNHKQSAIESYRKAADYTDSLKQRKLLLEEVANLEGNGIQKDAA